MTSAEEDFSDSSTDGSNFDTVSSDGAISTDGTLSTDVTTSTRPDIPLTTIFTPPASCLDTVTYDGYQLWQNGISQYGDPDCFPASFDYIYNSFFTPGICPQGWNSVGQVDHSSTASDAMCCPE